MYLYFVQILKNFDDNIHTLFNNNEIIQTIPEGYIKLFISQYPYEIVKSDHQEVYKNNNIYVQEYNDKVLINNFNKIQNILEPHSCQSFYYCPLQNANTILDDISSVFTKITYNKDNLMLFDKFKEKDEQYPILTSIVKKGIDSLNNIEDFIFINNPYYNQLHCEFTKYKRTEEYELFKEFEHVNFLELSLIEKLCRLNNNTWADNLKTLYNILFDKNDFETSNNFIDYYCSQNEDDGDLNVSVYKTWDDKIGIAKDKTSQIIQKDYFSEFDIIFKYKTNKDFSKFKNNNDTIKFLNNNYLSKKNKEEINNEKRKKFLKYFIFEFCDNSGETPINILLDSLKSYVKKVSPSSEKIFHYKNFSPLLNSLNYKIKKKRDGSYCLNLKII